MGVDQENVPDEAMLKMAALQQRYTEEATKRFRSDGTAQFVELKDAEQDRFRALAEDPWVNHAALNARNPVRDGATYKYLLLGTGYGALLLAIRLIQLGAATADDIRFVDKAGSFGGTWYWNRYPGLRCDVESYTYLPLLEETGYVPKYKYAGGAEIQEHAERIAAHWNLTDKALFRADMQSLSWDDNAKVWTAKLTEGRGPSETSVDREIRSEYVLLAPGILAKPQLAKITGLETFKGDFIHTARWNYAISGGSPKDPVLTGLEGKRVGIIGTGATAVQLVPAVAQFAKELYVFQRTPSTVSWRGQKPTDPEQFKTKIANKKGWQEDRMANFNSYMTNSPQPGQENLVADAWSEITSYCALIGNPSSAIVEPTPEKIGEHIGRLLAMDVPVAERLRARVDKIVTNPETASKLKAWYPTWCKRPTFSDLYLPAFNEPNVHLVDTDGKGVSSATESGLVVGDKEYPLDIIILATGYRSPAQGGGCPSAAAGIEVYGREAQSIEDKWENRGAASLHGITTNGFPNLFFVGTAQSGISANHMMTIEVATSHIAHVIAEAERRVGEGKRAILETTIEAEEAHSAEIMRRAAYGSTVTVCTPSYMTAEGEATAMSPDPAAMMKAARRGVWSDGMESWMEQLKTWRDEGSLKGLTVEAVASS